MQVSTSFEICMSSQMLALGSQPEAKRTPKFHPFVALPCPPKLSSRLVTGMSAHSRHKQPHTFSSVSSACPCLPLQEKRHHLRRQPFLHQCVSFVHLQDCLSLELCKSYAGSNLNPEVPHEAHMILRRPVARCSSAYVPSLLRLASTLSHIQKSHCPP